MSLSRDTDGVIHHLFCQSNVLTVIRTNSRGTGSNTLFDCCAHSKYWW